MKYKANMYVKDILSINYQKLEDLGIKCLFFDFDNTLLERHNDKLSIEKEKLLKNLQDKFIVYIISNSIHKKKLEKFKNTYHISYQFMSLKPHSYGFNKIEKKYNLKKEEICVIGDQLLTDIKGANKKGYFSILIDPINYDEHIFTKLNRLKEQKLFKRGYYYE